VTDPWAGNRIRLAAITGARRERGSVPTTNANVAAAVASVRALAPARPDVICLPENFLYAGLTDHRPEAVAVPVEAELIERFADLARESGALLAVPWLEAADDTIHNSTVLLDPNGSRLGVYRKQVLWPSDPHAGELEGGLSPGAGDGPFRTRFGPVGVRVCLEVQYPALWAELACQQVKLILFPSEQGGGAALRARAGQARSFVLSAVAKGGPSGVIDPVGHVAAQWEPHTASPVFDVHMDYELVHLDFVEERLRRLAGQLKGRVGFRWYEDERACLVSSKDPHLAVADLLREQGIVPLDVYLERVREQNEARRAAGMAAPATAPDGPRRVSVIVPTRGDSPGLRRCLAAVMRQRCELPVEIVVVLNGIRSTMTAAPDCVRVVHEPTRGPAAARNTGIHASTGDVVALVDDDCEPSPDWLSAALDALRRSGSEAIVAGAITRAGADANLVSRFDHVSYLRQEDYVRYSKAFVTANVIFPRSVYDRVGGFDESFPESAGEDWDWAWRAGRLGVPIVYDDGAAIDHPCMTDVRALRAKAQRLGRGEARLRHKHDPRTAPAGLLNEIGREVRRCGQADELSRVHRLRLQGLGAMVGYWKWRGRQSDPPPRGSS
jgi:predicted amidohydrolase/GT2 family glycosyltransferase